MSIIFGIRKHDGAAVSHDELQSLALTTARYAPDGSFFLSVGNTGMGIQPHFTHERSKLEGPPAADRSGNLLSFDGRLDNHAELCRVLNISNGNTCDSGIVLAAFAHWGEDCFSHFVGDWALALCSPASQSLYLARDHAGTRALYFEQTSVSILWSTYLETFFAHKERRQLNRQFASCYLACAPLRDLTPYEGVRAVTPAHYLVFRRRQCARRAHWQWMMKGKIRYRTATEYEDHFRSLFRQSVERRTEAGAPVLAQLSGGIDSSSIVCMSDQIRRDRSESLLDTVSYFDDSEPNWNEKPYFTLIERFRGKRGIHINVAEMDRTFRCPDPSYLIPGPDSSTLIMEQQFEQRVEGKFRAVLSGIGGDEILGGLPNPGPELADYLVCGQLGKFFRQTISWCLASRTCLISQFAQTAGDLAASYPHLRWIDSHIPPWIMARPEHGSASPDKLRTTLGFLPSTIGNGITWWSLLETLPHRSPATPTRREFRYPYLDRDLVEYLFRVPREYLVQPGFRRSLMRRALKGLVPDEILNRRRKAFMVRRPVMLLERAASEIHDLFRRPLLTQYGFVDNEQFGRAFDAMLAHRNFDHWKFMARTIELEIWLKASAGRLLSCAQGTPARRGQQGSGWRE